MLEEALPLTFHGATAVYDSRLTNANTVSLSTDPVLPEVDDGQRRRRALGPGTVGGGQPPTDRAASHRLIYVPCRPGTTVDSGEESPPVNVSP